MKKFLLSLLILAALGASAQAQTSPQTFPTVATITRLANATPYSAGQILCASASQCVASQFAVVVSGYGLGGQILNARLAKSTTSCTNAAFREYFFESTPTLTSLADGGAFLAPFIADYGIYIGYMDFVSCQAGPDGAWFEGAPSQSLLSFRPGGPASLTPTVGWATIWGVTTVQGAYTPGSAEVVSLRLVTQSN